MKIDVYNIDVRNPNNVSFSGTVDVDNGSGVIKLVGVYDRNSRQLKLIRLYGDNHTGITGSTNVNLFSGTEKLNSDVLTGNYKYRIENYVNSFDMYNSNFNSNLTTWLESILDSNNNKSSDILLLHVESYLVVFVSVLKDIP